VSDLGTLHANSAADMTLMDEDAQAGPISTSTAGRQSGINASMQNVSQYSRHKSRISMYRSQSSALFSNLKKNSGHGQEHE